MLQSDLFLVLGIIIAGLALPAIFGALADRRAPRTPAIMVMIGGGLIAIALSQKPGGYTLEEVPHAFVRVVAHYTR